MKTTSLLIVALLWQFSALFAQEYAFGVKGGFNTYSIGDLVTVGSNGSQGPVAGLVFEPTKDIGIQFGGYFTFQFGKFFVQPELIYMSSKNTYDFPAKKAKWTTSKIDFPILAGYEIFNPISIYVGPVFSFYGDTILDGVQITSFSDGGPNLEKSSVNLNIGIMASYDRFGIDLRYEIGSKETEEERLDINRSEYGVNLADLRSYKPSVLSLSVFVDIFKTDGKKLSDLFKSKDKCKCPY